MYETKHSLLFRAEMLERLEKYKQDHRDWAASASIALPPVFTQDKPVWDDNDIFDHHQSFRNEWGLGDTLTKLLLSLRITPVLLSYAEEQDIREVPELSPYTRQIMEGQARVHLPLT